MANKDSSKLIRIYGVTLAEKEYRVRPYGHGIDKIEIEGKQVMVSYVDYFIEDLIYLIKKNNIAEKIIKELKEGEKIGTGTKAGNKARA